ncbi:MAG: glutaredoxin family protein [Deltaproteobacteria bacterium]|nr:glutaredoxin family protein [Deltaproteobacteria bacterium]
MRTALLLLAILSLLAGCSDGVDHFSRATAIERELLRKSPDVGYEHPRYVTILRELNQVPVRSGKRDEADAMARRIMDARRIHLAEAMPQAAHLPDRLVGTKKPEPPRPYSAAKAAQAKAAGRPTPGGAAGPALTDIDASALDITLYSTTWCGYCRKARNWFTSQGIPFVEKDIENDPDGRAEYQAKGNGYGGVPLIDVNGTMVRGFDQRQVASLIAKAGK